MRPPAIIFGQVVRCCSKWYTRFRCHRAVFRPGRGRAGPNGTRLRTRPRCALCAALRRDAFLAPPPRADLFVVLARCGAFLAIPLRLAAFLAVDFLDAFFDRLPDVAPLPALIARVRTAVLPSFVVLRLFRALRFALFFDFFVCLRVVALRTCTKLAMSTAPLLGTRRRRNKWNSRCHPIGWRSHREAA